MRTLTDATFKVIVRRNDDGTFTTYLRKRDGTPHPKWEGDVTAKKEDFAQAFADHVSIKAPAFAVPAKTQPTTAKTKNV